MERIRWWTYFHLEFTSRTSFFAQFFPGPVLDRWDHLTFRRVSELILRLSFYWYNFMPLSRGTAAVGYMGLLSLFLSLDIEVNFSLAFNSLDLYQHSQRSSTRLGGIFLLCIADGRPSWLQNQTISSKGSRPGYSHRGSLSHWRDIPLFPSAFPPFGKSSKPSTPCLDLPSFCWNQ